jgi:hypothetical protein
MSYYYYQQPPPPPRPPSAVRYSRRVSPNVYSISNRLYEVPVNRRIAENLQKYNHDIDEKKKTKNSYPFLLILIYSILMINIGLALLILQILLLPFNDFFSDISTGIWIGAYFMVSVIPALLRSKTLQDNFFLVTFFFLVKYKAHILCLISNILQFIAFSFSLVGLVISTMTFEICFNEKILTHGFCGATSGNRKSISTAMIILFTISTFFSLGFLIIMHNKFRLRK